MGVQLQPMKYDHDHALDLLRVGSGQPGAVFREGQEEAIRHIVENSGRLLVVQKTGWGKSFVYFIATKLLREGGGGPALLISPLLALMRNQIAAAKKMGVETLTIHSDNQDEWEEVEAAVRQANVDILLISPERLANERFQNEVLAHVANRVSLLVVDEAHCISDWGHDFRPHYRLLERIAKSLPRNVRLLATTATANDRVIKDLETVLGPDLAISRGDLNRPTLTLQSIVLPSQAERLGWLAEHVPAIDGSGIIYTLTVRDANLVADWLKSRGMNVEAYTGESLNREALEGALLENDLKALVATTALGMGFDKPDLAFVIHYQTPGSVVAYYQQVGRAGRAIDSAYGVLLSGEEEMEITDYFIESAFPTPDEVETVLEALEGSAQGLSVPSIMQRVNLSKGRIDKALTLLSLESPSPVIKQGSRWQLTAAELSDDFWARAHRLTDLRREEQQQMQEYVRLESGHMAYLIGALDGDVHGIVESTVSPLPEEVAPEFVLAAIEFLRRCSILIEPRRQWPAGGMPRYGVSGKIPAELQMLPGRALCHWGDAGWGELVRNGKYRDGRYSDDLVEACARLISEWDPQPEPEWVTCAPSLRHIVLVPEFAARLASRMNLPFEVGLMKAEERPEQKKMENSTQQARNIDGVITAVPGGVLTGPVLLIDDIVDSRWTLTVAAYVLRNAGGGEVHPMALAVAGKRE